MPYCTGDVHIGNATAEYSPELTVQHKGWVNGTAARDYLAENFPDAAQVVVVGASAGSIAAPLYAGSISDLLPDAQITVLADSSGAYPDATNSTRDRRRVGHSRRCRRGRSTPGSPPGLVLPRFLVQPASTTRRS